MEEVRQDTQTPPAPPAPPVPDTAGNAFDKPGDPDSSSPFSFDDVIFGPEGERKPAEAPPRTQEQVAADTRTLEEQPVQQQEAYQAKNDDKRFEYWQSQAAKLQNENVALKNRNGSLNQYMNENPQAAQQLQQQPARYTSAGPVQPQQQAPPEEEFPPPPDKPDRPRNYSREAAYTDPASESAGYMDELDDWRDSMDDYNQLKQEYETARVEEYIQTQETQRQQMINQQRRASEQNRQIGEINEYVQSNYGLNPGEAQEFIREYSDPKSVSMENLVQLYRFKRANGAPQNPAPIAEAPPQPSPAFEQVRRAQQVPSPMGVQSGVGSSNPDDGKPRGQKFMEALIGRHNDSKVF